MATQQAIKRNRLLEQAERLFLEKGFKAVRVEEIAAAAGISKMTIYNQFISKENLFLEISLDMIRRFNQEVAEEVWKRTSTFDRLRVYFEKGQAAADAISADYYQDLYDMPYLIEAIAAFKRETTLQILWEILQEGTNKGEIQETDQQFVVRFLDVVTAGMLQIGPRMAEKEMLAFNRQLFVFLKKGLMAEAKHRDGEEGTCDRVYIHGKKPE